MSLGGVQAGDEALSKLRVFNASSRELRKEWQLRTMRGVVNMEGLEAVPRGWFTGGFDTQAAVVIDAASLETIVTVLFPRCSLPAGVCQQQLALPGDGNRAEQAKVLGLGGYNNWGGNEGYCKATARNPFDRRQAVLDGFGFSALTPAWAKTAHKSEFVVVNAYGELGGDRGGSAAHVAAITASAVLGGGLALAIVLKTVFGQQLRQRQEAPGTSD